MKQLPYRVGRARTGLGLFATQAFKKRQFIVEYKGPRISTARAHILEAKGSKYMYEINKKITVDGSPRSNIARYANHSCRPNAESDVKKGKVIIKAIKNIRPGDEITYDYGEEYFDAVIKPLGCKCVGCIARRRKKRKEARLRAAKKTRAKKPASASRGKNHAAAPRRRLP